MSNAFVYDDEISLLEAIRGSLGHYILESPISKRIYPYTSYILENVCPVAVKYDGEAVATESHKRVVEGTVEEFDFSMSDFRDIGEILKEIESRGSMEMDDHIFALHLLKILGGSSYTVNFILVGSLAAFAVTHGVWLLVLKFICANSSNRKEDISLILKRVEGLFVTLRRNQGKEDTNCFPEYFYIYISLISSSITRMPDDNWKSMDSLYSLIKTMLEVTSVAHLCLKNLFEYISNSWVHKSLMLLSMYWVVRGVLACSSACLQLPKYGYIIQNPHELEGIHEKLVSVLDRLQKSDRIVKLFMEDMKIANAYQIPNKEGRDNYFALMALFGLQPDGSEEFKLLRCSKNSMKQDASLVSLRRKFLVLVISGLNISSNEINLLSEIYTESITQIKEIECEFIWLPMYSGLWTTSLEEKYVKLKQMMFWYTVHHPTFLTDRTKKFIIDIWKFHRKTVAVVLNELGYVVFPNAIHSMYVWRAKAFPYSRIKMRSLLWEDEKRLDSLVLGFDPHISTLLEASKLVILFGGTDMDWIQKFIGCIQGVSVDSATSIQLIFIPKNGDSEIQETMSSTAADMSNNYPHVLKNMWYFWTRLESLLISLYQTTSGIYSTEPIIRQVQELLGYSSAGSWACLITPSSEAPMIHGNGDLMLKAFMEYDLWKQHVQTKNFTVALSMYVEQLRLRERSIQDYPCSRVVLNIDDKDVVGSLTCSHCIRPMEKKIQYRCCHIDE